MVLVTIMLVIIRLGRRLRSKLPSPFAQSGSVAQVVHLLEHGGAGNVPDTVHDDAPGLAPAWTSRATRVSW